MSSKYWIKLYHEILHDRKMATLDDRLWRLVIECFLFAGEVDNDGYLPKLEDIAWILRLSEEELETDLNELVRMGFLEYKNGLYFVHKFAERQKPMDKAEYMRRKREEGQLQTYYQTSYQSVTNSNVDKKRRESDTEAEGEADTYPAHSASDAVRIFGDVTGMVAIPGREDDRGYAIESILQISLAQGRNTKDYLTHYYQAWLQRGYSKINPHWLDWAIAGRIPPQKAKPQTEKTLDELIADAGYK